MNKKDEIKQVIGLTTCDIYETDMRTKHMTTNVKMRLSASVSAFRFASFAHVFQQISIQQDMGYVYVMNYYMCKTFLPLCKPLNIS